MRTFKYILISSIAFFLVSDIYGQETNREIVESDSIIVANQDLKIEILQLKQKVNKLNGTIGELRGDITNLTSKVGSLSTQKQKTEEEYVELERYANQILQANDSLSLVSGELKRANSQITESKQSVEVAANALRSVLENERRKLVSRTNSFKRNYPKTCTEITHSTKRGMVILDDINTHKLSWIDDFNVVVNTCFALPREEAVNNIKVYFSLYAQPDNAPKETMESGVPIVLIPNTSNSDDAVVYYEGSLTISLPTKKRKELKSRFNYEVEYQEEVIAAGKFKLD